MLLRSLISPCLINPAPFTLTWKQNRWYFLLTCSIIADGFSCYLCNGMQSSLQVCDEKIAKAHCSSHAKGADRCGIFSFLNASGIRVYGKSCVYQRYCESSDNFCKSVSAHFGTAKECEIECCKEEFCNYNPDREDDDSEECDWIDAGVSLSVSDFLIGACAMYAAMTMVK